jgi:hypothetical protein
MKLFHFLIVLCQFFISSFAFAHGPTPQKIDESLIINAPLMAVWEKVSDFSSIAEWHPMVVSATMEDEFTRVIEIKDKGKLTDSLDENEASQHYISYRLLEEDITVFPVSFYTIKIQLEETNEGTQVNWSGRFYRADTGNFPPQEYSDEAAVNAMKEYAISGMNGLKTMLEVK